MDKEELLRKEEENLQFALLELKENYEHRMEKE